MRIVKLLFIVVLFIITLVFTAENTHLVEVRFEYYGISNLQLPLFLVVFLSILFGTLLAGIVAYIERFHLKREINKLRRLNKNQEDELSLLRNLPLEQGDPPQE